MGNNYSIQIKQKSMISSLQGIPLLLSQAGEQQHESLMYNGRELKDPLNEYTHACSLWRKLHTD